MIVEELKKSLYLASFQGKLSKTEATDSSVDEALNKIIINKNLDNRELKKRKINSNYIELYNLPSSWRWVKLGYLCDVIRGLTFSTSYKTKKDNTILVLRGGNIDSKTEELIYNDNIYVDSSIPNKNQYLKFGDTLIVASSGTKTSVGKSAFIHDINKETSFGGFMMVVRPYSEIANPKYISYQIKMYRNKIINDTNGYISNITNEILNNLMIPLPPIEEQQRIVDKIEQLFTLLDELYPIENQLKTLKEELPSEMKKSIIDYAIHGNLSEHLSSDSNVNISIPLKSMVDDNYKKFDLSLNELYYPFKIPDNWKWVKLGMLFNYQNGYSYKPSETSKNGKGYPVIKSQNIMKRVVEINNQTFFVENPTPQMLKSKIISGDFLMCLSSQSNNPEPLGKTAIYENDDFALLNQRVLKLTPANKDLSKYLYYVINSFYFHNTVSHKGGGSAQSNLKLNHVMEMYIPLPPIEEQQRIVDKIEKILPLLDDVEQLVIGD